MAYIKTDVERAKAIRQNSDVSIHTATRTAKCEQLLFILSPLHKEGSIDDRLYDILQTLIVDLYR